MGRKLVSAEFHEKDVRTIEGLVEKLKEKDPSITLKKYVRLCVVQYTDAILNAMKKEIEDGLKERSDALVSSQSSIHSISPTGDKHELSEKSSERTGGVDSGDHQTEGRSGQDSDTQA